MTFVNFLIFNDLNRCFTESFFFLQTKGIQQNDMSFLDRVRAYCKQGKEEPFCRLPGLISVSENGENALTIAISTGNLRMCQCLVSLGAAGPRLEIAIRERQVPIIQWLLRDTFGSKKAKVLEKEIMATFS